MLHRPTASRGRARSGIGMAAAGLIAGLALTAIPAHADEIPAPPASTVDEFQPRAGVKTTYVQGSKNVTSTKGKKVTASLGANRSSEAGLSVTLSQKNETHSWSFEMPAKNLAVNRKGAGSLRTKAAAPFGKVALKIVPKKSWNTTKCKGKVVSKSRPVTLKGVFFFDSDSAWGAVGSKRSFALNGSVTVFTGEGVSECSGGSNACPTYGVNWYASSENVFLSGSWRPGASTAFLSGSRWVQLARPAGASRYDFGRTEVDAPELASNGDGSGTLQVKTGRSGAKGTATLSAGSSSSYDGSCKGGVTYRVTSWIGAEYTNGGTPLELGMSAFGGIKVPDAAFASFGRTVKTSG